MIERYRCNDAMQADLSLNLPHKCIPMHMHTHFMLLHHGDTLDEIDEEQHHLSQSARSSCWGCQEDRVVSPDVAKLTILPHTWWPFSATYLASPELSRVNFQHFSFGCQSPTNSRFCQCLSVTQLIMFPAYLRRVDDGQTNSVSFD